MVTARSNFNRFPAVFISLFLLIITAAAAFADTPIVSGQVVTDGGVTRFIYTVTNTLSSGYIFGLYDMVVPNGSILPMNHIEPTGWNYWYDNSDFYTWGKFYWSTNQAGNARLAPGQSAVFEVYTSSPVTTAWTSDWLVTVQPDEGRDYAYYADAALPIPIPASVPEPSSILALLRGLASVGGFVLRHKR